MRAYDCYNLEIYTEAIEEMANRGCEVIFVDWIGMIEAPGTALTRYDSNGPTKTSGNSTNNIGNK